VPDIPKEYGDRIEKAIHGFADEHGLDDDDVVEFVKDIVFIYEEFIQYRLKKAGLA